MLLEALDKALQQTLYLHRVEALRSSETQLEQLALSMFRSQQWDILVALSLSDLTEASDEETRRKAAVIVAAIAAALRSRIDRDIRVLEPGLVAALTASITQGGLAKYGIFAGLDSYAAQSWLAQHGGELVRGLNEWSHERLRALLVKGLQSGASTEQIAHEIVSAFDELSIARARTIARTEASKAWSYAEERSAQIMEDAGYVMVKEWLLGPMHPRFDICDDNNQAGAIPIHQSFPSGDMWTPQHPSCGCSVYTFPDPFAQQPWGTPVLGAIPLLPFDYDQGGEDAA